MKSGLLFSLPIVIFLDLSPDIFQLGVYVDDSDINLSLQSVSAIKASIACLPLDSIRAASTGDGHG